MQAKLLRDRAVKATLCAAVLIAATGLTSFASSSSDSSPISLNQQTILQFLTRTIDWNQQQLLDKSSSPGPDDIAFANVNLPAADQIVQLSFEFARAGAQIVRTSSGPPPADSRYANLAQLAAKLEASSKQDR